MICKYCGKPALYNPEICQRCSQTKYAVIDTPASALESIIRDVHLEKFMKEKSKK